MYLKNLFNFYIFRDVCEILLEAEADVDHCDKLGRTPLWAAASMGHPACVSLLLFWGCYVDSIDNEGRTVLSVSAAQGNNYVVSQLLDRGTFLFLLLPCQCINLLKIKSININNVILQR